MSYTSNLDIKKAIERKRLKQYEVAAALKISTVTLSRWLNEKELSQDKKEKILKAINEYQF